ncbi:retrotransposable element Tf2, partial [Tanacetum coccineum]
RLENATADALSRLQSSSELFSMISSSLTLAIYQRIVNSWQTDLKLKEIIEKLKQGQAEKGRSSWRSLRGPNNNTYKPELVAYPGLLQPLSLPTTIWFIISMDFIESLPKSQGKTLIFMIVDKLSKYAHFIPLVHPFNAIDVAQVFLDNIYKLHGLPNTIISDRDKVFLIVNRCLECYLRCMTGEQLKQWMKCMSMAEWWYNTNHHSAINTTPYETVYGQTPPIHVPYIGGESKVEVVDRTLSSRKESIKVCKFHLKRAQDRMKSQADKKRIPKKSRSPSTQCGTLPTCNIDGVLLLEPVAVLDRRLAKKRNTATVFVLIQWEKGSKEYATWEPIEEIQNKFPHFQL